MRWTSGDAGRAAGRTRAEKAREHREERQGDEPATSMLRAGRSDVLLDVVVALDAPADELHHQRVARVEIANGEREHAPRLQQPCLGGDLLDRHDGALGWPSGGLQVLDDAADLVVHLLL